MAKETKVPEAEETKAPKLLKIRLFTKKVQNAEGEEFTAFKTVTNDNVYQDVKFRKDAGETPTEDCFILVDSKNIDVESNNYKRYPAVWIHKIESVESLQHDKTEDEIEKLQKLFG